MGKLYNSQSLLAMMDGNQAEVNELANMMFDLGPQMIQEIRVAIEQNNWIVAGNTAHKLKSTLKLWQMESLVPLAFFIEENGIKSKNQDQIYAKFEILENGFNLAIEEMKLEFI